MKINYENCNSFIDDELLSNFYDKAEYANKELQSKTGKGNNFLGWVDLPLEIEEQIERIKSVAASIKNTSEVLVVIGIGGSYLGAKAVLDIFSNPFQKRSCEVIFAGHTMSGTYLAQLLDYLNDKEFSVNVISKSGTTTEPALAFRFIKELLFEKYGDNASSRIYATTDESKGALRAQCDEHGYTSFVIPDNVGGRYSVFTPVGLLPLCVAGIDIEKLIAGAKISSVEQKLSNSLAINYAAYRNTLHKSGKNVEFLVNYDPRLVMLSEWWKQLYGESEGKEHKGILPASLTNSTDLHSMGQYVQEGPRNIYETVIKVIDVDKRLCVKTNDDDSDELNYLEGKYLDEINNVALDATVMAHASGEVPNIIIELDKLDEYNIGYLLYFFEYACAISGYVLGVNPFDQPGVESYKKKMFSLLGKPGY